MADLIYLNNFLVGGPPPPPPMSRADVNCSGSVDGIDATFLKNFLKGSGIPPICCYYHCGMLYYHLNDQLGSTRVLVDSTGRMYAAYDYFATGDKTNLNWVYKGTDYQFAGKEYDEEIGLNMNYFGARYYDPKMGMFISIDPEVGKYPGWSPYAYTLDNPIKYLDPDGKKVEFSPGSSNEFKNKFAQAIQYLNKNKISATFAKLEKEQEIIFIRETMSPEGNQYDPATNTIDWNPGYAAEFKSGGKQSPSLILLHEGAHSLQELTNPGQQKNDVIAPGSPGFPNKEEERVVKQVETPAAKKAGEGIRKIYNDIKQWNKVDDPTKK